MMRRTTFAVLAGVLAMGLLTAPRVAPAGTVAEEAKTLWEASQSRYGDQKWKDASDLLEQFFAKYQTNEYVPLGCVQLAHCRLMLKQFEQFDASLDEVIKRFYGSRYWLYAQGSKLCRLKELKENDKYLDAMEAMVKKTEEAPLVLGGVRSPDPNHSQHWLSMPYGDQKEWPELFAPHAFRGFSVPGSSDWARDLVTMADTPARAERALTLLKKTLEKASGEGDRQRAKGDVLPAEWQFAHAALLRQAGQLEESKKTLDGYVEAWGKDPRAVELLAIQGSYLRDRKDTEGENAVFERLATGFMGYGNFADPLYDHLQQLAKSGQYEQFMKFGPTYLSTYPTPASIWSRWWNVGEWWLGFALNKATKDGQTAPAEQMLQAVDQWDKTKGMYATRSVLHWKLRLLVAAKKNAEAVKLAEELLGDRYWCKEYLALVEDRAKDMPELAKVAEAARAKRGIPPAEAKSDDKAAELLKQLQERVKDDQPRHVEEIAEELFAKYQKDPSTIQAINQVVDYYFKKLLVEPRDKWMDRMVQAYPQHPLTQDVLNRQLTAESAARRYDRLAAAADTAIQRFPGQLEHFVGHRVNAYNSQNNPQGGLDFIKTIYAQRIEAGDIGVLDWIDGQLRYDVKADNKTIGDFWMGHARRLVGTRAGAICYARAFRDYFHYTYWDAKKAQFDLAMECAKALSNQTLDPQLAWSMEFAEANLHGWKGDASTCQAAVTARLGDKTGVRDLSQRLDIGWLGSSFGKSKKIPDGHTLVKKLKAACPTIRDQAAFELATAIMCDAQADLQGTPQQLAYQLRTQAARSILTAVYLYPYPSILHPQFKWALSEMRYLQPQQYQAMTGTELARYMKAVGDAQDVEPDALFEIGSYHARRREATAGNVLQQIVRKYPASHARDNLEELMKKVQEDYFKEIQDQKQKERDAKLKKK